MYVSTDVGSKVMYDIIWLHSYINCSAEIIQCVHQFHFS